MSSRSAARLARAAMFQLEALEPRRFLSADSLESEEPGTLPAQTVELVDHRSTGVYPETNASGWFSFHAEAGMLYSIGSGLQNLHMVVYAPDGQTQIAESWFQQVIFKTESSGIYFL